MPNIARRTAGRIDPEESIDQQTKNAGEDIEAGQAVHEDPNGNFVRANATTAAAAAGPYLATHKCRRGDGLTGIRQGVFDGWDFSALPFNAPIFLSDTPGEISDTAGTVPVILGRVTSVRVTLLGSLPNKVGKFECPI